MENENGAVSRPDSQRDDALRGHGDKVKLWFPLPEEDIEATGFQAESLWADPLGDGRYQLDNIPFHLYDVSFRDVVSATEIDGVLTFRQVVRRQGHSTYRAYLKDPHDSNSDAVTQWMDELSALGASTEGGRRLIAIDVPPEADIHAIYALLERGEAAEIWSFEEGHYGR